MSDKPHRISQDKIGRLTLLIFLSSALFLTACGPPLSTRGSRVRLVTVEQTYEIEKQCNFLGNVRGSALFPYGCVFSWGFMRDTFYAGALNELLDNAAELGASHVFVNQGDGPFLIGEAYFCAFCLMPDGRPDEDYCEGPDGRRDVGYCVDGFGNRVGAAHCDGAEGKIREKCEENGGKWVPAIDEPTCVKQGHAWMPAAADEEACKERGGTWVKKAKDKKSCEDKGGEWIPNRDVLRAIPKD